ncbi:hypothetical protein KM043_016405 [Ampulex compressa]|nr:hypothetical protein KM043_016405 [Ampulex compressa]
MHPPGSSDLQKIPQHDLPSCAKIKRSGRPAFCARAFAVHEAHARAHACPISFSFRLHYFRPRTDVRRRGDPREIHTRVKAPWTNVDRPVPRYVPTSAELGRGRVARKGKTRKGEEETPTQVGPHTTVPSFVGHRMGMSCSTDTGYTALYTSWRCPAACRTSARTRNFMAADDCVRLV